MNEAGGRGASAPLSLDQLWALRTDFEDVIVPQLGGTRIRVYALTGTARAALMSEMAGLADLDEERSKDPAVVQRVMEFQHRVVAAAMGYDHDQWQAVGAILGTGALEVLWPVAARLSGLDDGAEAKVKARLSRQRSTASGSD